MTTGEKWVDQLVEDRLYEAARTLRLMRLHGTYSEKALSHLKAAWPDTAKDFWTAFGYDKTRTAPPLPSPAALTRMDEVLEWTTACFAHDKLPFNLPADTIHVVWGRAFGFSWRKIMVARRRWTTRPGSHETCRRVYQGGLKRLVEYLNERNERVVRAA